MAIPPALLTGWFLSPNAGYLVVITMAGYYLLYEGLHTLSHLDDDDYPFLKYIPLVNTVRRMHYVHHVLGFMQTRNFNLTFPICDWLFGTSDLDRGLFGTLFNGATHKYMRQDLKPVDPGITIPGIDDDAKPAASSSR
jgi:sterol desaturase/sphingolipid hydroxylase (fatty acid hydroxylase superfamily)